MIRLSDAPTKPRAAIYARATRGGQRKVQSMLEQQEKAGRKKCEERGFEIVGVFIDAESSGDDRERPEFDRMIKLACSRERPVDCIIATDMTRITRNPVFGRVVTHLLMARGAHLLLIDEDATTPFNDRNA